MIRSFKFLRIITGCSNVLPKIENFIIACPRHPRSFPPASASLTSIGLILGLRPCGKNFQNWSIPIQVRAAPVSNNQLFVRFPIVQLILGLNVVEVFISEKIEQICSKKAEIALVGVFSKIDWTLWTPEWSSVESAISLKSQIWHWHRRLHKNCPRLNWQSYLSP